MTIDISDNNPRIEYAVAQGVVQTVFAVPFEFFEDSDVSIYVDGTLKVLGTDYNLTGGDGSTGTATFVTATPPAVQQVTGATGGSIVAVVRHVSLERTTDFAAGQEINRASLNEQLDTITAQIADLDNKVERTIHLSDFEVAPSMLLTDDRKGRVLAFDTATGDVEAGPLSNDIQTIADNISEILAADDEAAAAAASATAAASSASAASSSASAAASSETAAETAETNAETAQTAAELAESNAATSETNAATSESNAATSATEAETAKTSAEAARDSALAALDSFDDRYLGVKTSEPTVDNDGDALLVGALYFNSTTDKLYIYDGTAWQITTSGAAAGDLVSTNNLSDLTSAATARTNLGLGTAATTASTDYATSAQGALADTATQPSDLGTAAAADTGDFATAAQGVLADTAVQPNDDPTLNAVTITDEIRFEGDTGPNALIQKNASSGRDELQIYVGGDAHQFGSRGAGIHLYGNSDNQHAGDFTVLTGPNDNGDARIIAAGREDKTHVTIGNGIFDYVDAGNDHALLNLKGANAQPALLIEGASSTEGDIVTVTGEDIQFGHWDKATTTFTQRMEIKSDGKVGIGCSPTDHLDVQSSGDTVVNVKSNGTGDADATLVLDSADSGESVLQFAHDGVNGAKIEWFTDGAPDLNLTTVGATSVIDMQVDGSRIGRFDASGLDVDGTVTANSFVLTASAVGTHVFAGVYSPNTVPVEFGDTISGANLHPASVGRFNSGNAAYRGDTTITLSGTWRCLGHVEALSQDDDSPGYGSLFVRIS